MSTQETWACPAWCSDHQPAGLLDAGRPGIHRAKFGDVVVEQTADRLDDLGLSIDTREQYDGMEGMLAASALVEDLGRAVDLLRHLVVAALAEQA